MITTVETSNNNARKYSKGFHKKKEGETNVVSANQRRSHSWKKQQQQFAYQQPINPMQFGQQSYVDVVMPIYQQVVCTAKKGSISSGGVITSIVRALGLKRELATLDPLLIPSLDIDVFRHMRLIKNMRDVRYSLMIGNKEVPSIILPCPNCTYTKQG